MFDYYQLQALVAVIQKENFVEAAKQLAITQSALSQRIKSLEQKLGTPVLIRANPVRATPLGLELMAHFQKVMLLESSFQSTTHSPEESLAYTSLPIAVNTESLSTWFVDAVEKSAQSGKVVLEILIEDQDRTIDLLKNGKVLGCVSSHKTAPHGCRSYHLGAMEYVLVATKRFTRHHFPKGLDGKSLKSAPAGIFGRHDKIHEEFLVKNFPEFKDHTIPYFFVPSAQGLVELCQRNLFYCLLPEMTVQKQLQSNSLVDLTPKKNFSMNLYWHVWSHEHVHLKNLTEAVLQSFKDHSR